MTKDLKRLFFFATIMLVATIFVSQAIFFTIFEKYCFPFRIISIIFMWLVTCLSLYLVISTVTDRPKAFNTVFMLQTTIKLALYMACIVAYLKIFRQHGIPFTLHFFVVYLFFAIFEVSSILKFVKKK